MYLMICKQFIGPRSFFTNFSYLFAVTSRSCSRAPAVNPDCSYHLVNILRATVCICDQPLCNGVNAFVNYTNTISRVFSNQNKLLLTNNHIRLTSSADSHKEDFMPLHDFDEQRIAAMLGTHNSANYRHWNYESLILLILCLLLCNFTNITWFIKFMH